MIKRSVITLLFLGIVTSAFSAQAGVLLPRMGAFIELDKVTPADPWEDRSSRVQWVLARLNCEGLRVYLLDPKSPKARCEVIYFDGPAFTEILAGLPEGPIGILQSADRKLIKEGPVDRGVQLSPRVSLRFHKTGLRRVVTVSPGLSDCFNDEDAIRGLGDAILWLAGLPENTPRIAPFPNAKRSAVLYLIHGEGNPEKMPEFQQQFLNGPGALTYAVSEEALSKYPLSVQTFLQTRVHEVAVHNHILREKYGTQDEVLSANIRLHQKTLNGHTPKGLIGPYLNYYDDLREALTRHQFRWFLDKDLPYPLNIPAPADAEPVIDITESLKPYDGWWHLGEAEALWRLGLRWKRLKNEIAVISWHDKHMAEEPTPYLEMMRYVKTLPDAWQTTALDFQSFWRDRWRASVEILSSNDRTITVRTLHAPAGLTLLRRRNGKPEAAVMMEGRSRESTLQWKPLQPAEDLPVTGGVDVRWGRVGSVNPRGNGLDTEFAVIHPEENALQNETVTLPLPEELQSRIGQILPATLRISTYGVKGLKFKDIKEVLITKDTPRPITLSFQVDLLRGQSFQFYRLRFPPKKKNGRLDRWQQSLRKRPIAIAVIAVSGVILVALLAKKTIQRRRRKRE
jgi:hypothetical protein